MFYTHLMDVFHLRCIRTIIEISWRDHVTNDKVLSRAKLQHLLDIVRVKRLKSGISGSPDIYLPEERPASVALNWEPVSGKRREERPQKTWRATFKEDLEAIKVTWRGAKKSCQ